MRSGTGGMFVFCPVSVQGLEIIHCTAHFVVPPEACSKGPKINVDQGARLYFTAQ